MMVQHFIEIFLGDLCDVNSSSFYLIKLIRFNKNVLMILELIL